MYIVQNVNSVVEYFLSSVWHMHEQEILNYLLNVETATEKILK